MLQILSEGIPRILSKSMSQILSEGMSQFFLSESISNRKIRGVTGSVEEQNAFVVGIRISESELFVFGSGFDTKFILCTEIT